jgi:selenocysteine lyase/cysteine desulfurase
MADTSVFAGLRESIPSVRHYVSLNSGGVAPTPQATFDLQQSWYDREAVMTTTNPDLRAIYYEELAALRSEIAALLNADSDEVALIRAVSEAVSFVAATLDLQRGDRVILTDAEHPSGYLAWLTLRDRLGLDLVAVEADGDDDAFVRDVDQAMTPNTRAFCLSHVTTERGIVLPVDRVSALARERGVVTVVDAAQSFGARPTDMRQLGCDVFTFPAFKWSMGPYGVGAMYVRRDAQERLHPWGSGAGAVSQSSFPPGEAHLHDNAQRYEFGARPYALYAAWRASIKILDDLGPEAIQRRSAELAAEARGVFSDLPGASIRTPDQGSERSGIFTVGLEGADGLALADHCLHAHRILCRAADRHTAVRLSFHAFNDASDIEAIANAFKDFRA